MANELLLTYVVLPAGIAVMITATLFFTNWFIKGDR